MLVKVTQDHINRGIKQSVLFCPIALALCEEQYLSYCKIRVESSLTIKIDNCKYVLPLKARDFIILFDSNDPVEPFEFEMFVA